jgi:hypothetical protein
MKSVEVEIVGTALKVNSSLKHATSLKALYYIII